LHQADAAENVAENQDKLLQDVTVAELAIRYPINISFLNEGRELAEQLVDELYHQSDLGKKPVHIFNRHGKGICRFQKIVLQEEC